MITIKSAIFAGMEPTAGTILPIGRETAVLGHLGWEQRAYLVGIELLAPKLLKSTMSMCKP